MNFPSNNRSSYLTALTIFVASFVFVFPVITSAATSPTTISLPPYNRLFYYQRGAAATQSFLFHANYIDIFAPQVYKFDETGKLMGSLNSDLLSFALKHKIKVMPLVTNGNFSQSSYTAILDDISKQNAAIAALVDEAKKYGYSGWQIDFEQMDVSYKDRFSAFMSRAYATMKQNGLMLSVAVVAKTSDIPSDYPNNLWPKLIGVYDYDALSLSADFISIMSYDDPKSNGPVVEYTWLKQVVAYSVSHIPKEKISLGIPFYYWIWNNTTGEYLGSGGAGSFKKTLRKYKVTKHYDTTQQVPYLTYKSHGQEFIIWYENAKSISQKTALVKQNGLYGVSVWALGQELPDVWSSIRK